jgi:hypothetical protein
MSTAIVARRLGATAIVAVTFLLAGCGSPAPEETAQASLGETKSPVQLLRNAAASRIADANVEEILLSQDLSTACQTPETDPEGLLRAWRSTIRLKLTMDAPAVGSITDDLVASFVEQGWTEGTYGSASIIELTRGSSPTNIHISTTEADEDAGEAAEIQIQVAGPCVPTDGADSQEVRKLESDVS